MTAAPPVPRLDPWLDAPLVGPRVLSLVGDESGCSLWRVWQPTRFLRLHGYPCDWVRVQDPWLIDVPFEGYQAIVLCRLAWYRATWSQGSRWLGKMKRDGLRVLFECDDDLFTPAVTHQQLERPGNPKSRAELDADREAALWALAQCDGVTVSTQYLASTVRRFTDAPVEVVPNAIDAEWFRGRQQGMARALPGPTVGWVGGNRPDADLEAMAVAWGRIARRYPDVAFVVMGHHPPVVSEHVPPERLLKVPWLPPDEYPKGLVGIDIGCCPLQETPFNRSKCVVGETLVYTDHGPTPISQLSQSRVVDSISPLTTRVWTTEGWAVAEGFYYGGEQETVRVTTERGFQIEGTLNHPVRRADMTWGMLGELEVGDELRLEPVKFSETYCEVPFNAWAVRSRRAVDQSAPGLPVVRISEPWGAFLGYLLGDGNLQQNALRITCDKQDQDVVDHVVGTFQALGLEARLKQHHPRYGGQDVMVSSARLNDFLWFLGLEREKRRFLAVPSVIRYSPKSVVREFLRALFEADGTVSAVNPRVTFTSKSQRFARDVQLLLTGFGIVAGLVGRFNKVYQRTYYTVALNRAAVDVFGQEIGFVGARKRAKVDAIIARSHSNAYRPQRWADPVVEIERHRRAEVFDVVVPGKHEFGADGFIAHNTPIKAWEYALSGAAVVASPTVYRHVVRDGENGLLAHDADDWEAHLAFLLDHEDSRRELQGALERDVRDRWSLKRHYWRWPTAWNRLMGRT